MQMATNGQIYTGPAGVVLTPDETLIVWSHLTRLADSENAEIRRRCRAYLTENHPNRCTIDSQGNPIPRVT